MRHQQGMKLPALKGGGSALRQRSACGVQAGHRMGLVSPGYLVYS